MTTEFQKDSEISARISDRAGQESLIESFGIVGLHGYRNISIESEYAASILIAKNGTGKTTLLGALDAFLRLQLNRLRNLEFQEIRCRLRGAERELVLTQQDLIEYLTQPIDGELFKLASRCGLEPNDLFNFVIGEFDYDASLEREIYDHPILSKLWSFYRYDMGKIRGSLASLKSEMLNRQENIAYLSSQIRKVLLDYDIVYLPTYRRVELALTDEVRSPAHRRRHKPKFKVASGSLFTGDIQFGLSDIKERLSDLNQQITIESNNGYREISANIINDLIDGSYQNAPSSAEEVPTEIELRLFFSRLKDMRRMGPFAPVAEPNLEKLYSEGGVPENSRVFLRYFVGKLKTVIDAAQKIERPVQDFIDSCNKYLNSWEPSTTVPRQKAPESKLDLDGKELKLNRRTLQVHVESLPENRKIPLDALSSGEKQMVSLFAKLFLYPKRKIVLIDEPELSLSIDWQQSILVDVLNSTLCDQLIAITHSPFVFENELEPFARSLLTSRSSSDAEFEFDPFDDVEDELHSDVDFDDD